MKEKKQAKSSFQFDESNSIVLQKPTFVLENTFNPKLNALQGIVLQKKQELPTGKSIPVVVQLKPRFTGNMRTPVTKEEIDDLTKLISTMKVDEKKNLKKSEEPPFLPSNKLPLKEKDLTQFKRKYGGYL